MFLRSPVFYVSDSGQLSHLHNACGMVSPLQSMCFWLHARMIIFLPCFQFGIPQSSCCLSESKFVCLFSICDNFRLSLSLNNCLLQVECNSERLWTDMCIHTHVTTYIVANKLFFHPHTFTVPCGPVEKSVNSMVIN